jgi:hypothetical protein
MFSSSLLSPMPVILQAFLNIHRARRWMPNWEMRNLEGKY